MTYLTFGERKAQLMEKITEDSIWGRAWKIIVDKYGIDSAVHVRQLFEDGGAFKQPDRRLKLYRDHPELIELIVAATAAEVDVVHAIWKITDPAFEEARGDA